MNTEVVEAELNKLRITIDAGTGSIIRLVYPVLGAMVETSPDSAGIIDLAYPIEEFEPLRLASRFSHDAQVTRTDDSITIHWDELGLSRPSFDIPGKVSATVRLKAADDGRSVIMSGEIHNQSQVPVRQVIFPDFMGLVPFAGERETEFRTIQHLIRPFIDLLQDERKFNTQGSSFVEYEKVRWMNIGGLKGGFSLFQKRWGWDTHLLHPYKPSDVLHAGTHPHFTYMLDLSRTTRKDPVDRKLRIMCAHKAEIRPGEKWESGEFWLTPHKNGWARGIEPYSEWVKYNMKREYPIPAHIRKGLGFRSVAMCKNYPDDPQDVVWMFRDLPKLAKEAKDHGLVEMGIWAWHDYFTVPFPPAHSHLGGEDELVKAVGECKKLGVNVSLVVSVSDLGKDSAPKYGLTVGPPGTGWTQHPEFLPRMHPYYASKMVSAWLDPQNEAYQEDVLASWKHLIDIGIPSLCWDGYVAIQEKPNLQTLTEQARKLAKRRDPESTLTGEDFWNMEVCCNYFDYTCSGVAYRDIQAFTNAFPAPRPGFFINTSPEEVKLCFADNIFINVWPTKPDSGSDWIENHPDLSLALKQCAKLRALFLPYFTDGTFIGNCVLSQPCPDANVTSYVLPDKALIVVINRGSKQRALKLRCDLASWLRSDSGKYEVKSYDQGGKLLAATDIRGGRRSITTGALQHLEIALFEVVSK